MSSKLLSSIAIFAICSASLSACSSVSDGLPVVKIERKKPQSIQTQSASYVSPSPIGSGPTVQKAEAAIVCENENMRTRAADKNNKNDSARVLILEDGANSSSQVVGDIVVNCRDYFANKSAGLVPANYGGAYTAQPPQTYNANNYQTEPTYQGTTYQGGAQSAPTSAPYVQPQLKPASTAPRYNSNTSRINDSQQSGLFYSVKRGDSLYRIAVNHCTSVDAIARLNNIDDPTSIDVHDILRMPVGDCD